MIDIKAKLLNDKKIVALLQDLSNDKVDKVIKSGVSYAARGAKKNIAKGLIGGGLNLSSTRIKAGLEEPKIRNGGFSALVWASQEPVTATSFKAKQNARGLGVSFYKGQRHQIKGGFYAKGMPLARVPGKRWPERFSTRFIHGPSISQAYLAGQKAGEIKGITEKELDEALVKGIMRRLGSLTRNF
jgi:hypothetical protein